MSNPEPRVSIILPFRNEERTIEQSVISIVEQDYAGWTEILAINDGSKDKSVEILKRLKHRYDSIRLIETAGSGEAQARNAGVCASSGQVIVNFSAHAVAAGNFLRVLVSKLNELSLDVAGVGCKHKTFIGRGSSLAFGEAMRSAFGGYRTTYHQHETERFVESVAFTAYRARVFATIGLFDPAMGEGADAEFNLRLGIAGYKLLYTPETNVYHLEVTSPRAFFAKLMRKGAARVKVIRKHPWSFRPLYALPSVAVLALLLLAAGSIFHERLAIGLLGLVLIYASCSLFTAVRIIRRVRLKDPLRLMLAFPLIHVGYGLGFIKEMIWPS